MTVTSPTLSLRPVDPTHDAPLLHRWVTEDRAQFWMMLDYTVGEVRELYQWIHDQPTHSASIIEAGGRPAGILQTYRVDAEVEPISKVLDHRDGDLGIHFFIAPGATQEPGWTRRLAAFAAGRVLSDPAVTRVVMDPDVENVKAIAVAERIGAVRGPVLDLGFKTAQVLFLGRPA